MRPTIPAMFSFSNEVNKKVNFPAPFGHQFWQLQEKYMTRIGKENFFRGAEQFSGLEGDARMGAGLGQPIICP